MAFSTASAGVRNVRTDSTGPKISSRAIRWAWETPVKSVGGNQKPRSGSGQSADQRSAPSTSPDEARAITQVPGSLETVLDTLEADHDYLLEGGVFTPDLIETWLDYKRSSEIDPIRLRPHPHEFELYFDA